MRGYGLAFTTPNMGVVETHMVLSHLNFRKYNTPYVKKFFGKYVVGWHLLPQLLNNTVFKITLVTSHTTS